MRQPSIAPQQSQRRVVVSFDTLAHPQGSSAISFRFLDSHVERMSNRQCSWRRAQDVRAQGCEERILVPDPAGKYYTPSDLGRIVIYAERSAVLFRMLVRGST